MSRKSKIAAVIVAGGTGERLGGDVPKQYRMLRGKKMICWSIDALLPHVDTLVVVINPAHEELFNNAVKNEAAQVVCGGDARQDSVRAGLEALADDAPDVVLIHDAARPFVSDALINRVVDKAGQEGAAIPVIAVRDTVKQVVGGMVSATLDRASLVAVQTPQGFDYKAIFEAHQKAKGKALTDDAAVAEAAGGRVFTVEGDAANRKITTMDDLNETEIRIGQGYDVHAFADEAGDVMLCGVAVPHEKTLQGHSDADVGLHALVDALLGAIGAGDIGEYFPPSDAKWKGADSAAFVNHAVELVREKGGEIVNADITLICEQPKIGPYKAAMRERVAALLGIEETRLNVKATTTEGLGFTGRDEGIAAQVVVSVRV